MYDTGSDCAALRLSGLVTSGVYTVYPKNMAHGISLLCDMVTDGGGWTVIQRRFDGSVDFYLDWNNYKRGFGTLYGEFWLGNDNIHRLTTVGNNVLRIELQDWSNNYSCAVYDTFMINSESDKYKLTVGRYSGTAGDSLSYHSGMYFSTKDQDNERSSRNCGRSSRGAWWYSRGALSRLNGFYHTGPKRSQGLIWYHLKLNFNSLKRSTMMIRRT